MAPSAGSAGTQSTFTGSEGATTSLLIPKDSFPYPAAGRSLTTGTFHQGNSILIFPPPVRFRLNFPLWNSRLHLKGACDLLWGLLSATPKLELIKNSLHTVRLLWQLILDPNKSSYFHTFLLWLSCVGGHSSLSRPIQNNPL